MTNLIKVSQDKYLQAQSGVVGYALAWLLGIPASILLLIFILRGCD